MSSAYYDAVGMDMDSPGKPGMDEDIHVRAGGYEDASPPSRHLVGRNPAETPSSAAWLNPDEEDVIDFRFGTQGSRTELGHQRPTAASLQPLRGRPKAVAKLLVRSGLRCHKCHLKTWVCLCDRAPVEVNRSGTEPGKSGPYMSSHALNQFDVAASHWSMTESDQAARPGHAGALQDGRREAIPEASTESRFAPLHTGSMSAGVLAHGPLTEYFIQQHCLSTLHPNLRFSNSMPIRGPKSAPEPYPTLLSPFVTSRLRGVRVPSLSAGGGGGLCRAQPKFLSRPGKQAEGIHKQLGFPTVPYSRDHSSVRSQVDIKLHCVQGMPTCKHCGQSFQKWHGFKGHILSACPVLHQQLVVVQAPSPASKVRGPALQFAAGSPAQDGHQAALLPDTLPVSTTDLTPSSSKPGAEPAYIPPAAPTSTAAIADQPVLLTNISIVHVTPRAQCRLYVSHVMFRLKPHPRQTVAAVVKVCRLWLGRSGVEKCRVDHKIGSKTFMVAELLAKASS